MRNKKGYIKTLEAVISIVAILMFTFGITPTEAPSENVVPFVVENSHDYIVEILGSDESIRELIINSDPEVIDADFLAANESVATLVSENVPLGFDYEFKICKTTTCLAGNPPIDVSVYGDDIMIVGADKKDETRARIIRVWFWPITSGE